MIERRRIPSAARPSIVAPCSSGPRCVNDFTHPVERHFTLDFRRVFFSFNKSGYSAHFNFEFQSLDFELLGAFRVRAARHFSVD
jgi:hypothetical protein